MSTVLETLKTHLGDRHAHLLRFWDELDQEQRRRLAEQILAIDVSAAAEAFERSQHPHEVSLESLTAVPEDHHAVAASLSPERRQKYWNLGLEAIARGEVAAIVLAGGQASRLGATVPKGVLPLQLGEGVAVNDCLLGIQAAKIARLEKLAREHLPGSNGKVQWLVMTSKSTDGPTKQHLEEILPAVGLSKDQVTFFSQGEIPSYDLEGSFLLSGKDSVATAPDGNGGLYAALAPHLPTLESRGVKYVHVYCVDNITCRVADPVFVGYAIDEKADCAAKAVEKTEPKEAVGVICVDDGKVRVVEYSELSEDLSGRHTPLGVHLMFRAGSIANHFFTTDFLRDICAPDYRLPYHRAQKKIPHMDASTGELVKPEKPNGVKLEQFVFDVFEKSRNFHIWEVVREEEFAPLKNGDNDCPSTCRAALAVESTRWLREAGAIIPEDRHIMLRVDRTYSGEGLEEFKGRVLEDDVV